MKNLVLSISCLISLSLFATEKSFHGFTLDEHTAHLSSQDWKSFKSWMGAKNPSDQKQALIDNTILNTRFPLSDSMWWDKGSMKDSPFDALLNSHLTPNTTIQTQSGFYTYSPNYAFWVDFANKDTFGGGFRQRGNVQEERMFMEFPALAQLAYALKENSDILPVQNGDPEPFLIPLMGRKFSVENVPYGRALENVSKKNIQKDIVDKIQEQPKPWAIAHIIGLAAKDYSNDSHTKYSLDDLKYHLRASLCGFLAAREYTHQKVSPIQIHTGAWGAGAFKNSPKMLTALQILAAQMSSLGQGSTLVFHAMGSTDVTGISEEIATYLHQEKSPLQILNILKAKQDTDSSWRPQ